MGHFLPFRLALVVLVLAWVGAILGTDRSLILGSRPMIDYAGEAKVPEEVGDMTKLLDDYGVHTRLPRNRFEEMLRGANTLLGHPPRGLDYDDLSTMTKPVVGYAVREWSFLGLALGWQADPEPAYQPAVMYAHTDWEQIYSGLKPGAWEQVNRANGRDVTKVALYPFWNHTWGWLVVLWGFITFWLWSRANARRREELGII